MSETSATMRGDGILHPLVLASVAVLALNDQVLKYAWGGWLTGKLSDVAGMVFFPILLQALLEVLGAPLKAPLASRRVLMVAMVATAVVFSSIQLFDWAAEAYRVGLGALQWPYYAARAWLAEGALPALRPVRHTMDATDLIGLVGLCGAWWAGRRRESRARAAVTS